MTDASELTNASVVAIPRGVRLQHDPVRNRQVLLAPERVLFPCDTSIAVLEALRTPRTLEALTDELVSAYDAPRAVIEADIRRLVAELRDQMILEVQP